MSDEIREIRAGEIELLRELCNNPTLPNKWFDRDMVKATLVAAGVTGGAAELIAYSSPDRLLNLIESHERLEDENADLQEQIVNLENQEEPEEPLTWKHVILQIFTGPIAWMLGLALAYLMIYLPEMIKNSHVTTCIPAVIQEQKK